MSKQLLVIGLRTGEELIGTVYNDADEYIKDHGDSNKDLFDLWLDNCFIVIHVPVMIVYKPPHFGMLPYQHYTNTHTILISKDNIVTIAKPSQELADGYNSKFGTGIAIVTKPKLVV